MQVENEKETPVKCPEWCTTEAEHDPDGYMRFHWGPRTSVYPKGIGEPVRVRVSAYMESVKEKADPAVVLFGANPDGEKCSFAGVAPKDARVLASVIEILSGATPEQQREYAAGARAAADAIEIEPEAE